jgi:TfoX/Sxy family transcriptional regulator of competence genes
LAAIDIGDDIQVKPFFGGAAAYTKGNIFLSLTKVGFAVKLPISEVQDLLQVEGAKKLQYFPNAPIKKEYVILPNYMVQDPIILREWVIKSLDYARIFDEE